MESMKLPMTDRQIKLDTMVKTIELIIEYTKADYKRSNLPFKQSSSLSGNFRDWFTKAVAENWIDTLNECILEDEK